MKLRNFLLAWCSLCLKFLNRHFSTKIIIKAFVGAFLLANFIFLSLFENSIADFCSPFLTLAGIYIIINLPRAGFFAAGFFTGILWFYWIGFSFIYYELGFLIPFIIFFIGLIYGLIFWLASFPSFISLRAVMLFLVSYIHPFGFNWLNLEATLVLGIFEPSVRGLIFVFLAAIALACLPKFYKFIAAFVCLVCALQFHTPDYKTLPFKIKLENTQISQDLKWQKEMKNEFINENLDLIERAIDKNFTAVVLPESAFPLFMTHERNLVAELKEKSRQITIIAGALAYENKLSYNSTFVFSDGQMTRLDKFILVPFGEEIPLPKFIKDTINRLFFNGASDFATASSVSDYELAGAKIRNAICYEATRDELFSGEFDAMIAITNNGWFVPSTEPALQRLLLKYYATKYAKAIYHSVNGSPSEIITPKISVFDKF